MSEQDTFRGWLVARRAEFDRRTAEGMVGLHARDVDGFSFNAGAAFAMSYALACFDGGWHHDPPARGGPRRRRET